MTEFIEPLPPSLWFRRIEKIADGALGDVEHSLRHAAHLLRLAPVEYRHILRLAIEEDRFELLLANGDLDSAARELIAQPAALAVEEQEDHTSFRATIGCALLGRAVQGVGETMAAAVLAAWSTCLLALETNSIATSFSDPAHRDLLERHRRLS